jgi:hypothetical protein
MVVRFGTWNVRSLYRSGSMKTATSELAKYKLEPVAAHEVSYDNDTTKQEDNYTLFYGNENANHHLGTGFFLYQPSEVRLY